MQTGIAGSLLIHALLLLLFVWGWNSHVFRHTRPHAATVKKEVLEIPMIFAEQILPPKPEPKPFIRTSQNEAVETAPAKAAFQSDRNTRAGSELPPVPGATAPLPTMIGNVPAPGELANRDYRDGEIKNDSAPATPDEPPVPMAKAVSPAPEPPLTPPAAKPMEAPPADTGTDTLKVATAPPEAAQPKPQVREPEEAPPPPPKTVLDPVRLRTPRPEADSFSPFTRTRQTEGGIQTPGENSVDAEATPLGVYMRQVTGAVEKKWHMYVRLGKDAVTFGRVRFRFYVDPRGVPQDLKILSDARDADPRMRELTLRAILDAQIPPIPAELLPTLEDGRVKIEYEAIIY